MFGVLQLNPRVVAGYDVTATHNCGICKEIGFRYGHWWRWAVFGEAVFLADLLYVVQKVIGVDVNLSKGLIGHCFQKPHAREIPAYVKYAAAVSLLIGMVTLQDKIDDGDIPLGVVRKPIKKLLKKANRKIIDALSDLGYSSSQISYWRQRQLEVEQAEEGSKGLAELVLPVSILTGTIYGAAAALIGAYGYQPLFFELGFWMGRMLMILDAYVDFERDVQKKRWNLLSVSGKKREEGPQLLQGTLSKIQGVLWRMLPERESQVFFGRVQKSIYQKMGCTVGCEKQTFLERTLCQPENFRDSLFVSPALIMPIALSSSYDCTYECTEDDLKACCCLGCVCCLARLQSDCDEHEPPTYPDAR